MNIISAMKKYTVGAGVLAMLAVPVGAAEVGEKMPNPTGTPTDRYGWGKGDKNGYVVGYLDARGEHLYKAAYHRCNRIPMELPFGIMDFKTMTLYLDNDPLDGIVDEVVTEDLEDRSVGMDAPDCGEDI